MINLKSLSIAVVTVLVVIYCVLYAVMKVQERRGQDVNRLKTGLFVYLGLVIILTIAVWITVRGM
jgi:hypothetical protein